MTNPNEASKNPSMEEGMKEGMKEKDWRKLCQMVASEPDAQRLSELVEALLKELDRRKENGDTGDDLLDRETVV